MEYNADNSEHPSNKQQSQEKIKYLQNSTHIKQKCDELSNTCKNTL